jgi:hypothetical protein
VHARCVEFRTQDKDVRDDSVWDPTTGAAADALVVAVADDVAVEVAVAEEVDVAVAVWVGVEPTLKSTLTIWSR